MLLWFAVGRGAAVGILYRKAHQHEVGSPPFGKGIFQRVALQQIVRVGEHYILCILRHGVKCEVSRLGRAAVRNGHRYEALILCAEPIKRRSGVVRRSVVHDDEDEVRHRLVQDAAYRRLDRRTGIVGRHDDGGFRHSVILLHCLSPSARAVRIPGRPCISP